MRLSLTILWVCVPTLLFAQQLQRMEVQSGIVHQFQVDGQRVATPDQPLATFLVNEVPHHSHASGPLTLTWTLDQNFPDGVKGTLRFKNSSKDTVRLANVVPFGTSTNEVYITGLGNHRLSRTHIFLPGRTPVNVIVPDNAWELGFRVMQLSDSVHVYGLARRDISTLQQGLRRRFETVLYPGGEVSYQLHAEAFTGAWQEGLTRAFHQRKLYDLAAFDSTLYKREDLKWIRSAYVMHLLMAWDKDFYDGATQKFTLLDFVKRGKRIYGGDDVVCIWPTWPSLGVDQRNQFDLYRDLPGGLSQLKNLADSLRLLGTRFFIAYNPWDESTRKEDHLQGLAELIGATTADGVVLDTKGESSGELQAAADGARGGVIMYSEGMAVPKDMPGIVSGRVHNALYYPPVLNLNKLIQPDFAIFRVAEVFKEPIVREYATSFFNGYGTEINQFAPGHPEWEEEQYRFLGRTTRILREHSSLFTSGKLTPLLPTARDSIWVNEWQQASKTLFTVFSQLPHGFDGPLFEVRPRVGYHFVDVWNHEMAEPISIKNKWFIPVSLPPFRQKYLGTNSEGAVGAIAGYPQLLKCRLSGNWLFLEAPRGNEVRVFAGMPTYQNDRWWSSRNVNATLDLFKTFGDYEGKVVVQLLEDNEVLDEVVFTLQAGTPRLVSEVKKTTSKPRDDGMVKVPAGKFVWRTTHGDAFIPYPETPAENARAMPDFWMDKFPVTNRQFQKFLVATGYTPADKANFLKHWEGGKPKKGEEDFPVVYISYEDAQAYAAWAGKRLPTEVEWQYAAQTSALREWPWNQTKPVSRKQQYVTETLTVSAIEGIDPRVCNLGDDQPYRVGSYPKWVNPLGLHDLVGCVWQLTNDVYESGSYRYIMMKGGSYFKPSSSWWYVQGGPRELHYRQYLLRVSQGFERNATVGFRCVKDMP